METILAPIVDSLVAFIVLFVILFIIVSYFSTGKKLVDTIRGFFLLIASLVYSPFKYFKKSLMAIAQYRLEEAVENEGARQYLLVRFLTSLQGLLAVIVVAMIAFGGIRAWESFLPPKSVREQNARLEKAVEDLDEGFSKLNLEVTGMETNWTNNKQALLEGYRKEQEAKAAKATSDDSIIDQQITSAGAMQSFFPIKRYIDQNQSQSSVGRYESIKKEALDYIKSQDAPAESKRLMSTYVENWCIAAVYKYEQANFREEQYRTRIQPDYVTEKANLPNVERQLASAKEQLKNIQPLLKYDITSCVMSLLGTLLAVVVLIWFVGLVIELLWLGVDIAGNVDRIRTLKQNS
jgi:hypothetical protein